MSRGIKFPIEMENEVMARTLDEVRENFSLERMIGYYVDGTLLEWLDDRYYEAEADAIGELNISDPSFKKKMCEIFQVPYTMEDVDVEKINRYITKIARVKQVTDDPIVIHNARFVAFSQEELAEILDDGFSTIYLCNSKFVIPLRQRGIQYIGVNSPTVVIPSRTPVNWADLGIQMIGCEFDDKYKRVLAAHEKTDKLPEQIYEGSPLFSSYLDSRELAQCGKLHDIIKENIDGEHFDMDDLGGSIHQIARGSGLDSIFDIDEIGINMYRIIVRSGLGRAFQDFCNRSETKKTGGFFK